MADHTLISIPHYQLTEQLHDGVRTLVYRGQSQRDGQPVVIKLLKSEYPSFMELVQFRNQYAIAKHIAHPAIVQPLALEPYHNSYALIMADEGHISLKQWMGRQQSPVALPVTEVLAIALQLADTLEVLHHHRIIHKDIKPANILIHPHTKTIKLADFSIASLLPQEQQVLINPNVLEGTLAYIAPEQTGRMNRGIDYRTDFYSLGVTLYELLAGRLPFTASDPMEIVHCHIAKAPPPLPSAASDASAHSSPAIPAMVAEIVLKLMAKNAEDRYQTAMGLKHDLSHCLDQLRTKGSIVSFALGQQDQGDRFLIPDRLYGRDQEVATLLEAFDRIAGSGPIPNPAEQPGINPSRISQPGITPSPTASRSELMLVAGYSGVGKTAVINELHKPISRQRGYFIKGKFDQFQRNIPFSAFVQALRELMNQILSESNAQLARWKTLMLNALGDSGQVIVNVIPELEAIIGPQPAVEELAGNASQNRFNRLFQRFIHVFTQPQHPLVLFLDDLQWADAASLHMMQLMMTGEQSGYLLLLGAYRDNEVSSAHPLMLTLEDVERAGGKVQTLTLQPLNVTDLRQLVADTLHCTADRAAPLTHLIHQKTHGNPFFATQFLKGLYEEQLITYTRAKSRAEQETGTKRRTGAESDSAPDGRGWQCDMAQIRERALTDDVVEFMGRQLKRLPPDTQTVLSLAACIGNQFDLETLAVVGERSPAHVAETLWSALRKAVIVPISETYKFYQDTSALTEASLAETPLDRAPLTDLDLGLWPNANSTATHPEPGSIRYQFLHDRVQQAAYALIDQANQQATHLHIGHLLLRSVPEAQQHARVFEIVNQLNMGRHLVETAQDRVQLAQLNQLAGQKAKQSTAYDGALEYFETALALLGPTPWQQHYDLTLTLHDEMASTHYVSGHFEEMDKHVETIFDQAHTLLDQVPAYDIQIQSYLVRGRLRQAIDQAVHGARLLQIELPTTTADIQALVDRTQQQLAAYAQTPDALMTRSPMENPEVEAAVRLLASANSAAYVGYPEDLPAIISTQVSLLVQHGNTPLSAFVYAWYGTFLCKTSSQVELGYYFGQLALDYLAAFPAVAIQAKTQFMVHCMIFHWKNHGNATLAPLMAAYRHGRDHGDIEYAAWAILVRCEHLFCMGHLLPDLKQEFQRSETAIRQCKQASALSHNQIFHQATLNLLGEAEIPHQLDGQTFSAHAFAELRQQGLDRTGIFHAYLCQLILSYLFNQPEAALDYANQATSYASAAAALMAIAPFYLYDSLIRLSQYHDTAPDEQQALWQRVSDNQVHLEQWANQAPANHSHRYALVEAERYRVMGDRLQAIDHYDRAIAEAKTHGYRHEEALANELAARFYIEWDRATVAQAYMQAAYYGYARWGAKAKVEQLEQSYPTLLTRILDPQSSALDPLDPLSTLTQTTSAYYSRTSISQESGQLSTALDFSSLLKATQALSSTIELPALLHQLAHIILENSGAERCILILPGPADQWEIRAIADVNASPDTPAIADTVLSQPQPIATSAHIPVPLINYVQHRKEPVILSDTETTIPGIVDGYLLTHRPRSVLCQPLLNQGNPMGVLYLENRVARDVFTRDRTQVINVLCTQAAIALENAHLYQQLKTHSQLLEQRVQERTLELESAKNAADAANRAKSDFLANMSHELRTPLNSIIGFAQILGRDPSIQPEPLERITIINRSGEHLLSLINNILEMSKVEAGQTTINPSPTDLHRLLHDVQDMFQAKAQRHGIQFVLDQDDAVPPYILTDESKLRQVLINLVGNATKFTQQGRITILVRILPSPPSEPLVQQLQIQVQDTGPGIAPQELASLFNAFTQTDSGRNSRQGTGLGLAISEKFIRLMGGEITVDSTVGIGTTFTIRLPFQPSEAPEGSTTAHTATVIGLAPEQPRYRMLVVDDAPDNRQVLSEVLTSGGLEVQLAYDGQEAITVWQEWQPHVIWMDLRMPVMDGMEATRRIRALEAHSPHRLPTLIVAITASVFDEKRDEILQAGFDEYMIKPFKESVIWSILVEKLGIQFIYGHRDGALASSEESKDAMTPQQIAVLLQDHTTAEWRHDLAAAAAQLKRKRVLRLLEQLPSSLHAVEHHIKALAEEYEFGQIQAIAQPDSSPQSKSSG